MTSVESLVLTAEKSPIRSQEGKTSQSLRDGRSSNPERANFEDSELPDIDHFLTKAARPQTPQASWGKRTAQKLVKLLTPSPKKKKSQEMTCSNRYDFRTSTREVRKRTREVQLVRHLRHRDNARPDGNWFVEHWNGDEYKGHKHAVVLEFKAWQSLNWPYGWRDALVSPAALRVQKQIRKYVVAYQCPHVIVWDGATLLLLVFKGGTTEDLEDRNCDIEYWAIEFDETDGVDQPEILAGLYWLMREGMLAAMSKVERTQDVT